MVRNKLKKILVPLDGSSSSNRGLNFAVSLAKITRSDLVGLNVFTLPSKLTISTKIKDKIRRKSEEVIKHAEIIAKKADVSFTGITKIERNVGQTVINFAMNQQVDLIIIGSRGPDPEFGMFLGSVANYIVNKSKIPVTIVK